MGIKSCVFDIPEIFVSSQKILDAISIEIQEHSVLAIVGPNGAGKSTLLEAIAFGGFPGTKISVSGNEISQHAAHERKKIISFLSQEKLYRPLISATEFLELSSASQDKIQSQIELWNICHIRDSKIPHISNGEFQKLQLIETCIKPHLLCLLDEPETHLDPSSVCILKEILMNHAEQSTILFSTHHLNVALSTADMVLGLNSDGAVAFFCSPKEAHSQKLFDTLFHSSFSYFTSDEERLMVV